ncbi:MAG: endopeptidase La [Bacillota bacterium]|nr:endopeptidase La [Bacillota bacterium]
MNKINIIKNIPLIPLRGLSILPHEVIHFDVGRDKSIRALEDSMINEQLIFLITQKDINVEEPYFEDLYEYGVVCRVKQMLKLPGDAIRVLVEGKYRAKIDDVIGDDPYFKVNIEKFDSVQLDDNIEIKALMRAVLDTFERYVAINTRITPDIYLSVSEIEDPDRFADIVASNISLKLDKRQELIKAVEVKERLNIILGLLTQEKEILEVENEINTKVKININKKQKEYYLREKIKAIQEELGEDFSSEEEIEEMTSKLKKLKLDTKINEKIEKEIKRLRMISPSSGEGNVIRTYINWILDLPWNNETEDNFDLKEAGKILNEDHYGLKDVKTRVLEYLAIRKLKKSMNGSIICLVGPPGVGKTSIAKSIARAIGREFCRMSLGGVKDEAEIRGHRRTYIGAIPGRIINAIKESDSKNPVFLFDEIDKISSSYNGDPASALLEVLDPEQNKEFTDHYLEVPFDLSKVLFITTANNLGEIPRPLRDRMEIISIPGYTEDEKLKIALKYLVKKQLNEHGLNQNNLKLSEKTLKLVINSYTRESGVRELERQIGALCRKVTKIIVEDNKQNVKVNARNLKGYLGIPKYSYDLIEEENEVGVVRGLAWTSVGGDTLSIEVATMKGDGELVLTGNLGDIMKESAKTAQSYIRSITQEYDIDEKFYENTDIHIHIPEGAVPKDGPSAGITMATAMISALLDRKVDKTIAMTGEITLRGRVLPIGGLKEKSLAAKRAGIKTILIPYKNIKNLEEIPNSVKKAIKFIPVKTMQEVLEYILIKDDENENS